MCLQELQRLKGYVLQPESPTPSGYQYLKAGARSTGNSAACDALIRALIYLTRKVLPSTRAHGVRRSSAGNHPARDPANQSIRKLHQDKGIKIPGFLISPSYFIIIDLKLAERYQAAAGSWEGNLFRQNDSAAVRLMAADVFQQLCAPKHKGEEWGGN